MAKYAILLVLYILTLSNFTTANDNFGLCAQYLNANGVVRVESLLGRQTRLIDMSNVATERRAITDSGLRVINLGEIFETGKPFLGFGRPNVYLAIPGVESKGLGYIKVDAKSLKREDTKLTVTNDRVQSGLLLVFKDLPPDAVERIIEAAKQHEGTRRWTCVNANCQILADAGFTTGAESLREYYFPVALLKDLLQHGLEYKGKPVEFDVVKTTPGYLEDIGLSIMHAVSTTVCRHADKACDSIAKKLKKNTFLVKVDAGLKAKLGLAIFKDKEEIEPIIKPIYESQTTPTQVPEEDLVDYDLAVSEPSQLGTLLRLVWGPHSLFEVALPTEKVDHHLPKKLKAYPDENPSLATRIKKNILFNPSVIEFIGSHLARNYQPISDMNQNTLLGMLRTDSEEIENKYNFVLTGSKLIVMKIAVGSKYADWVLSKHVLMSQYSDDVRIAGEIWKTADGTMHFNINSGTYQPSADLLPQAEKLFREIFMGIAIESAALAP